MAKLNKRKCIHCKTVFQKQQPLQSACSYKCAIAHAKELEEKKKRREWMKRKKQLRFETMTHKDYLKLLQIAFNTFIRHRDERKGCISCGTSLLGKKFDAGHYRSVGSSPHLRVDENNCHGQCVHCNRDQHGNLIEYRKRLIKRIGIQEVERIENYQSDLKLSIPEIQELTKHYKEKTKELIENQKEKINGKPNN